VEDKKSERAGTSNAQLYPSSAISAHGGSKSEDATAHELLSVISGSNRPNGVAAKAATEKAPAPDDQDQSLGAFLIAAREHRGFAAEDVVRETRLPPHYLRMMESNDYSKISDRLYLVPFLRRYASFLELDQEDVAMRFVREVQRSDSSPPARLDQPLMPEPRKPRGWTGAILVVGFLTMAAGVYLYESDRHRTPIFNTIEQHTSASGMTGPEGATSAIASQPPTSH
jgi:cytoskeletal protein RodZ